MFKFFRPCYEQPTMKTTMNYFSTMLLAILAMPVFPAAAADDAAQPKEATRHTIEYNRKFAGQHGLDFQDKQDFQDAERGFIATIKDPQIKNKEGAPFTMPPHLILPGTSPRQIR